MDAIYNEILDLVKAKENFAFEAYKLPMLIRRIDNRILKTKSTSPQEYLLLLKESAGEAKKLLNNFLINVSHFFRDPLVFEFIKERVLPELIAQIETKGQKTFRIWSAGCAKGEEAYSLAILIDEYCKKEDVQIEIDFFATDYDLTALECAKKGEYKLGSLDEVKFKHQSRYFIKSGDKYTIEPSIKSKIQFSQYNLLDKNSYAPTDSIFGEFDLILCRNVLIYFNEESQNLIFDKLYKSLSENKLLVLGSAEVPPKYFGKKFHQINDCCKIYRKIDL